jgi:2,3-bisphosphoglycerate-dependent phosphoglycerate mutase
VTGNGGYTPAVLELWLVRHGETTRSRDGRLAGRANVRLTGRGREEARRVRPLLTGVTFDGVWCSDLTRARTTAALAWGVARPDPRLRELDFGELEGRLMRALEPEHHRNLHEFRHFAAPGGEDLNALHGRACAFVASLPPGRHLVFAHGAIIRSLTMPLGLDRFLRTGSLVVVDWPGRRIIALHERPPQGAAAPGPTTVAAEPPGTSAEPPTHSE